LKLKQLCVRALCSDDYHVTGYQLYGLWSARYISEDYIQIFGWSYSEVQR